MLDNGLESWDTGAAIATAVAGGVLSMLCAVFYAKQVLDIEIDTERYPKAYDVYVKIQEGAAAFLKAEYMCLSIFVAVVALVLLSVSWQISIAFIIGAMLSAITGYLGMYIATRANLRTTLACSGENALNSGLRVAFKSGAVMGLTVVSTGILGVSILYAIFDKAYSDQAWRYMSGFAAGASSIALFARVGGGIYTKAADVGADLVGKVEAGLEEDDPNNPATIADNVGDNVGDVAGMGADLFESYAGSIIAAATLGRDFVNNTDYTGGHPFDQYAGVALPFWIAGLGAICSIIGTMLVRTGASVEAPEEPANATAEQKFAHDVAVRDHNEHVLESLLKSIRIGIYGASALVLVTSAIAVIVTFGTESTISLRLYFCVVLGLVVGNLIGYFTEYATSYTYLPTQSIARKSDTGPATVVIQGLGVGMLSTIPPVIFVVIGILGSHELAGVYGISIAGVGMLSTLGVTLATDAYGPVADNAGGIAEMAEEEIPESARETTDALDALGNTTAATGKGFAIGSAVLTAVALMSAFADEAGITPAEVSLLDPVVLPGVLMGALMPFVFAALTMLSVGKAAESIMFEVRRQLHNNQLDHEQCVAICTKSSLQEMLAPGAIAILSPVIIGFLLGAKGLLGMLVGSISSGFLLAVTMSNAGGAWDNSKKYVEKGNLNEPGVNKGKKTSNHDAVVVGDTIGDPFKDTSGPALNILIKLMSVVALVLAKSFSKGPWSKWVGGLIVSIILLVICVVLIIWRRRLAATEDAERAQVLKQQRQDKIELAKIEISPDHLQDVSVEVEAC